MGEPLKKRLNELPPFVQVGIQKARLLILRQKDGLWVVMYEKPDGEDLLFIYEEDLADAVKGAHERLEDLGLK